MTCHDGFTLNDLVSYNQKHNEANGEGNRDGTDDNRSWNCGAEGPSDDPVVEQLRNQQVKNFLTITMLSAGMPMMLMGDEVRRTQFGNNNAYCQDNETSWFDWTLLKKHADVHRFVTLLNARRRLRNTEIERQRISLNRLLRGANLTWHGVKVGQPDWSMSSHSVALTVEMPRRKINRSPDRERVLGSSRFRATAGRRSERSPMASLDQHRTRFAAGYRSLGSCSTSSFIRHTRGTVVGDRFVCRALRKPVGSRGVAACGPAAAAASG